VRCIGVLSGGISRAELIEAGTHVVYRDACDLLENIDDSPIGELVKVQVKR
jgi:hypothetical protein